VDLPVAPDQQAATTFATPVSCPFVGTINVYAAEVISFIVKKLVTEAPEAIAIPAVQPEIVHWQLPAPFTQVIGQTKERVPWFPGLFPPVQLVAQTPESG
jgi:hypothetical protein